MCVILCYLLVELKQNAEEITKVNKETQVSKET